MDPENMKSTMEKLFARLTVEERAAFFSDRIPT